MTYHEGQRPSYLTKELGQGLRPDLETGQAAEQRPTLRHCSMPLFDMDSFTIAYIRPFSSHLITNWNA